jgi:hypothetical protein
MCEHDIQPPGYTPRDDIEQDWRWRVHLELIRNGHNKAAFEFLNCEDVDTWHAVKVCPVNIQHHSKAVMFSCHLRICPECARRDAARLINRYKPHIEETIRKGPRHWKLRHITLTTKFLLHAKDAKQQLRKARGLVNEFLDRLLGPSWWKTGQGVLVGAEYGPEGHLLHFHILHYGPFQAQEKISEIWGEMSGFPIVWVTAIGLEDGLREIIKYVSKLSEMSAANTARLFEVIKGTRRVWSRGSFFRILATEQPQRCKVCGAVIEKWSVGQWRAKMRSLNLTRGNNSSGKSPPKYRQLTLEKPI